MWNRQDDRIRGSWFYFPLKKDQLATIHRQEGLWGEGEGEKIPEPRGEAEAPSSGAQSNFTLTTQPLLQASTEPHQKISPAGKRDPCVNFQIPQHSGKLLLRCTSFHLTGNIGRKGSDSLELAWNKREVGQGLQHPVHRFWWTVYLMAVVPLSESTASSSAHLWCGASNLIWPGSMRAALPTWGAQPEIWPSHWNSSYIPA